MNELMNMFAPDRAVVEVPDSNMILVIGHDKFGCVELSVGLKRLKISQDFSIQNNELTSCQLEVLRKRHAFRVSEESLGNAVKTMTHWGLIRAVNIDEFKGQPLFELAGEAHRRWLELMEIMSAPETVEIEPLSM